MSANRVRVPLLKVTRCQDAMMWYAPLVGCYVPCLGLDHGEWKSRQPSGFSNFIAQDNARLVHVLVGEDRLGEYPYKYAKPVPRPDAVVLTRMPDAPQPAPMGKLPCKDRCDMLGVCRGLSDCEEAAGRARWANHKPPTPLPPVGQSQGASAIEAGTNIALGFGISVGITAVLLPIFGHQVTLSENVAMTSVFTVASFLRAYGLRRLFNWLHCKDGA